MIDDYLNAAEDAELETPPPARFDESANANAQPVQPIPTRGVALWMQRARDARQVLTTRRNALALVLVGGLAMGTLGGTMLVKERNATDAAPPVQTDVQTDGETEASQDETTDPGSNGVIAAAQASAMASQSTFQTPLRNRRHRLRPRLQRSQQAYRVAVIR